MSDRRSAPVGAFDTCTESHFSPGPFLIFEALVKRLNGVTETTSPDPRF